MTETFHDIMVEPPRPKRWDGDRGASIRALVGALDRAGLPDQLQASLRLLDRATELSEAARQAKTAAAERLARANVQLTSDGPIDVEAYGRVLAEVAVWVDENSAAPVGVMAAVERVRANAAAIAAAESTGTYRRLQDIAHEVVTRAGNAPALPKSVWAASGTAKASTAAIQGGAGRVWEDLVLCATKFQAVHEAGLLLRETDGFPMQLWPAGAPEGVAVVWRNWRAALLQHEELRHMPGPLRLRAAIDRGLEPGLWLASDLVLGRAG